MAYDLCDRFPNVQEHYRLLDPGAYQYEDTSKKKQNTIPFISKTPRNTQAVIKIWTDNIYNADVPPKIPNCTAFLSKLSRFPYEAFSNEDLEAMLCKCGIEDTCVCSTEEKEKLEVICQAKQRKSLFIGPPPKSSQSGGLSCPSKRDHGFKIQPDGSLKRIREEIFNENPPFYDATVNESTAYYQGCKWSKWTSKRSINFLEARPGPADYNLMLKVTPGEICAEKYRHHKRKTSKQLRYIEAIQQRNILEGHPGPASYNPTFPKGLPLKYLGPKSVRFPINEYNVLPGPTNYSIRRDFDPPDQTQFSCHAKLPEPACFGTKAQRFKPLLEEGPSPATYFPNYNPCPFLNCSQIPFGCSTERFKDRPLEDDSDNEIQSTEESQIEKSYKQSCDLQNWEFKSQSIRMKPLEKKNYEPSPADFPQQRIKINRPKQRQYLAPFFSSEGRFQPWNDWMPIHGRFKTPGPCCYNLEKPKCIPAIHHGPLQRAPRFLNIMFQTPAPNAYKLGGGIETILSTHNQRIKNNIKKQDTFHCKPPREYKKLNFEEKEAKLLQKSILLLDHGYDEEPCKPQKKIKLQDSKKPKLLRCFLYKHQIPNSF
ncbi:hypothetical protein K1T71_000221 [Dendrolimus kikuchii]|uniref:Uncharacterized protein n=1 Tax=Dendrolimus kikuchii TaxID=765133 RepID=A0ACC1DIJ1_9NEOP|nr:hypothetical protein K1T71_000221 [Dendrolimus kikuchii]